MTKIAIVGDTHADARSRLDEHNRIMRWIGERCADVDAFVHTGDVFERASSTGVERLAVADYLQAWAQIAPVIVVAGNHDGEEDIEWIGRLKAPHPIYSVTSPRVIRIRGVADVACLPWPRKGNLLAELPAESHGDSDAILVQALRSVIRGLGQELSQMPNGVNPRVFAGHVQTRGSKISISQPPLAGQDFELGLEDLAACKADLYALGHIHLGQEWDANGSVAIYPGSPRRCNYGETEEKRFLIATLGGDGVNIERISTPATPMLHVAAEWHDGALDVHDPPAEVAGADVRIRYKVASDQREPAKAAANALAKSWLDNGAVAVKVEPEVVTETRARMPHVAEAKSPADKLEAFWRAKSFDPGERRAQLLEKFHQLG